MSITLCCLLWAHPGQESALVEYEDRVLALLPHHGATLVSRVRFEWRRPPSAMPPSPGRSSST